MSNSVRAFLVSFIVGVGIVWGFKIWKDKSFSSPAQEKFDLMDQMEKQGIPDFEGTTIDGKKFHLQEVKGRLVVVNFWASWCSPCLEEFPSLLKLVQEMKGELVLVAVSQDSDEKELMAFLKSFPEIRGENIFILRDSDQSISKKFEVDRLPESFFADRKMKLVQKIIGSINWASNESLEFVHEVANKKLDP